MNMMAPSPAAVPNLLDGGLLNPTPLGQQAPVHMNHEPVGLQPQNQDLSAAG